MQLELGPRPPESFRRFELELAIINRADVKKIMVYLAHHKEEVIFLGEPNLVQSRITIATSA